MRQGYPRPFECRMGQEEGAGILTGMETQQPVEQKAQTPVGSLCRWRFVVERASTTLQTGWLWWRSRPEVGRLPPVGGNGEEEADVAKTRNNWLKCRNKRQGGVRPS